MGQELHVETPSWRGGESLQAWLANRQAKLSQPVVQAAASTLQDIIKQDLKPDPTPSAGKKGRRRGSRLGGTWIPRRSSSSGRRTSPRPAFRGT